MFDPHHAEFWVLIAFILFAGVLIWKGVPGLIAAMLDARAAAIRTELDEARRSREEAQQLLADYQRKAREAEEEAKVIIEQAQRGGADAGGRDSQDADRAGRAAHEVGRGEDCPRRGSGGERSSRHCRGPRGGCL